MSPKELSDLKKLIIYVANYYSRDFKPEVISMMASDLSDLDFDQVRTAYEEYRSKDKTMRFPLPAMIREIVEPEPSDDNSARTLAAKISQAVTRYGWCNEQAAKNFIGPVGWRIVERKGGWNYICQNLGVTLDPGTFEAQNRELAKVELECARSPAYREQLEAAMSGKPRKQIQKTDQDIIERRQFLLDQAKKLGDTND